MTEIPPTDRRRTHVPRRRALYESRREREFYRYFEPIRQLTESGPQLCDLYDQDAVKAHQPVSSPDRALTAFCQLGALRLGTRRAMLFFFDTNYAYVLAEATRTLSLQDDSVHEIADELWLGHSAIPRGFSICEETVCRVPDDVNAENSLIHIINDIDQDTQFCDKPYVNDGPKAKFYAGVPITTPKGITIGAYCCLDDKTHDGLDEKGVTFLKDMAATVMTHLEMVRAKSEHIRGTQMISGLGSFIEGGSALKNRESKAGRNDLAALDTPTLHPRRSRLRVESSPLKAMTAATNSPERTSVNTSVESFVTAEEVPDGRGTPSLSEPIAPKVNGPSRVSKPIEDLGEQLVAMNIRSAFQRAADVIREAVDVDGVAFWDTTPSTYGGLVETQDVSSDQTSDTMVSGTDVASKERPARKLGGGGTVSKVLASSLMPYDRSDPQKGTEAIRLTEKFLRSLLRRNPHGKIWNFNEAGDASSDDDSSEGYHGRRSSDRVTKSSSDTSGESGVRKARRRLSRIDDGREIQRLFPGVRSLALTGIWDQNRDRWYSVCAIWTYSPLRLFSQESEVNYMSAFCDVIMAEVHRLEAQNADKMKSDFISSVSHELRSPLHGILGSVECLQDQPLGDSFSSDLVSQIEVCGRTLVDIVDHLLDYSKITNLAKAKRGMPISISDARTRARVSSDAKKKHLGTVMVFDAEVSLDHITEEVVETAVYSFCCSRDKKFIVDRKVAVILDIDRSAVINWRCRVPLGGWKRICINLCSNALKYTSEGFIKISLKAEPIPGKKRWQSVAFTVSDSGRGMSKDFMENHLFKAFSQEDSLMEGTGLGMSLVAKIVRAMGGKIDVQSEKGIGSTMAVTVPVETGREASPPSQGVEVKHFDSLSIAMLDLPDATMAKLSDLQQTARDTLLTSIENQCHSLGVQVVRETRPPMPEADVYLITEQDLHSLSSGRLKLEKPLIVVCNTAISLRQLRADANASSSTREKVEYVAQPCGTERLSKAIKNCLTKVILNNMSKVTPTASEEESTAGALVDVSSESQPPADQVASELAPSLPLLPLLPIRAGRPKLANRLSNELYSPPVLSLSLSTSPVGEQKQPLLDAAALSPDNFPLGLPTARTLAKGITIPTPSSGLSLLLVEDNPINLQLLVNYARKQGHGRNVATDGQQAVDVYKAACMGRTNTVSTDVQGAQSRNDNDNMVAESSTSRVNGAGPKRPDVILMDINMPIMNGFEATRLIRAFEREKGMGPVQIIALTGLGSASAQQEAFSSGVDLFLTKPVRLKELSKVLDEVKKGKEETRKVGASGIEKGRGSVATPLDDGRVGMGA